MSNPSKLGIVGFTLKAPKDYSLSLQNVTGKSGCKNWNCSITWKTNDAPVHPPRQPACHQVSVVGKPIQSILLPTYSNRIPPSKHPGIRIPLCPTTCDWAMEPHNLPKPIEPHWTLPNWSPFCWWIPNTKFCPNTTLPLRGYCTSRVRYMQMHVSLIPRYTKGVGNSTTPWWIEAQHLHLLLTCRKSQVSCVGQNWVLQNGVCVRMCIYICDYIIL